MKKQDADRPTRVRFAVVAAAALMAVLLYLDRFCISFAEVFIKEDLGLSDFEIGVMLSAFFWTYALGQVPSGWLSDRFGARRMLTAYVLLWSAFTALTGMAWAFLPLLLFRFGFGFGQAGAYPTSASLISKWVPFPARGLASSVVAVGGRIGGALAPLLTALLIVQFVPAETSSRVRDADLLDPAAIVQRLSASDESNLVRRIGNRLSAAGVAVSPSGPVDLTTLVGGLNELIGGQPLVENVDQLRGLAVESEARRILERGVGQLATPERERLNRLLLEAVFPGAIRQVYGLGWRKVMWVYGAAGAVLALLFWVTLRDRPADHPRCNPAELARIEEGRPPTSPSVHGRVGAAPLGRLLASRSMWLVCISQWCTNVGWVFLVTWLPRYLDKVHAVPVERRGLMTFVPVAVGWFGMLAGGWLTDAMVDRLGLRWGRALPMSLSRFTAMAAYLYCIFAQPSAWSAVAAFALVAFSTDLGTGAVWAFNQDVGGRYVGSVLGWSNMWGNLGAAVTPPLLIWIVGQQQSNWDGAFWTCAAAFLISGIAALVVDATIPIAPDD